MRGDLVTPFLFLNIKQTTKRSIMSAQCLSESELILNSDGSVYHLNVLPGELATDIILVGDPHRVPLVSAHFDRVELKKSKREFVTHTGWIGSKRISVIGTGIGAGNIDIVMNEVDAIFNIDLQTREIKSTHTPLRFLRLGTTGGLSEHVPLGSLVCSQYAFGLDGLLNFYQHDLTTNEAALLAKINDSFAALPMVSNAYCTAADAELAQQFAHMSTSGITLTCAGFYGPQGRWLRLPLIKPDLFTMANTLTFGPLRVTNLEMETAVIYGLGKLLGHACCSVSMVVANRVNHNVPTAKTPTIENMIAQCLPVFLDN